MSASFRLPLASDVSLELATRAHCGTSHTPERRGENEVDDYVASILSFQKAIAAVADTDDRMAEAVTQSECYRENYIARQNAVWSSRSRMMSTMIAGPANRSVMS